MPPSIPTRRDPKIHTNRKITLLGALAAALGLAAPAAARAGSPAVPVRAGLTQAGRRLILSVRTSKPIALSQLARQPRGRVAPYLCFELRERGSQSASRLCLGGERKPASRAGLALLGAGGEVSARRSVPARLKRPEPDKLVLALLPEDAGLAPGRYRWRVIERRAGCPPARAERCEASLPAQGERLFRLRAVRAVGCTGGTAGLLTNGPRDRKVLALTFDDGPSEYTPEFLRVLREKHVPGTFFEIGQEMSRYPGAMREIIRQGNEIGNHTTHHTEFPGYGDIAPTTALAEQITHFRPCLFRPPGGAVNAAVIGAAGEDGLLSVTWDVDPADWSNPGTGAIYSRIVDTAHSGSIVLMHDGGGNRSETLAALPQVIDTLRARGYRFATVTELLGNRMIYKPYG